MEVGEVKDSWMLMVGKSWTWLEGWVRELVVREL